MMSNVYTNRRREAFLREQRAVEARREREIQKRVTATTVAVVETIRSVSEPPPFRRTPMGMYRVGEAA